MFETEVLNGLLRVGGGREGSWICAPINKTNLAGKQCLLDIKPNFLKIYHLSYSVCAHDA